jgi:hypothetical protein
MMERREEKNSVVSLERRERRIVLFISERSGKEE